MPSPLPLLLLLTRGTALATSTADAPRSADGDAQQAAEGAPQEAGEAGGALVPAGEEEPSPSSDTERLDQAIALYLAGRHEEARAALSALLVDPTFVDPELRLRARAFLGEILFVDGERDAAWDTFRVLLEDAPNYSLDPYEHPPDVVRFFDTVKAAIGPSPPPPPEPQDLVESRPPLPVSAYLPFGLYHFTHERPVEGLLFAAGESLAGLTSLLLYADLHMDHSGPEDEIPGLQLERAGQWFATFGFYGLWFWQVASADRHWHAEPYAELDPLSGSWCAGVALRAGWAGPVD